MLSTIVRKNESFEKAVRRFETECRKARILQTYVERTTFVSKSERKHLAKKRKRFYSGEN
jgi:ribosomal protein S21